MVPDRDGFSLSDERDGDGDGIKETHIKQYRNRRADSIFVMTTHGHEWAWSMDLHGEGDADITRNYVIRDSDCDGVFDERYSLSAEFHVPACMQ